MYQQIMCNAKTMYESEPNIEIKLPVLMQGLNEPDDEYRERIIEYMEQQHDR